MAQRCLDTLQQLAGAVALGARQAGDRLVEQHQPRRLDQQHADLEPLLLAVRQQPARVLDLRRQARQFQRVGDAVAGSRRDSGRSSRQPPWRSQAARHFQVLAHRQAGERWPASGTCGPCRAAPAGAAAGAARRAPSNVTRPRCGRVLPLMTSISVVLPAPFGSDQKAQLATLRAKLRSSSTRTPSKLMLTLCTSQQAHAATSTLPQVRARAQRRRRAAERRRAVKSTASPPTRPRGKSRTVATNSAPMPYCQTSGNDSLTAVCAALTTIAPSDRADQRAASADRNPDDHLDAQDDAQRVGIDDADLRHEQRAAQPSQCRRQRRRPPPAAGSGCSR